MKIEYDPNKPGNCLFSMDFDREKAPNCDCPDCKNPQPMKYNFKSGKVLEYNRILDIWE